ncbi:hypothetical protein EDEG_04048 [Edhazardia aedis USNM 41457]|uniref:Uncharacterized protein n=1 Tax=Edhazardia aedis (strain USNM 41457) TaxID=1003232 RepID=J8ZNH6_EDHAE|nr:hypothetical protein EDEG_04048 [Edhazardia aedis USNM 41457]|eukprot:EJW01233.1 hypothetical protein EDEG_04048 [Edhazardia aedis USNM 41457]
MTKSVGLRIYTSFSNQFTIRCSNRVPLVSWVCSSWMNCCGLEGESLFTVPNVLGSYEAILLAAKMIFKSLQSFPAASEVRTVAITYIKKTKKYKKIIFNYKFRFYWKISDIIKTNY